MSDKLPLIVASIVDTDIREDNYDILSHADILELRIDLFDKTTENHILKIFSYAKDFFKKPIIATIRHPSEGGNKQIDNRLEIYKLIERYVSYIDIELAYQDLIISFRKTNKDTKIIGSYHNFECTPEFADIERLINLSNNLNVDIVKIATMANTSKDLLRLFDITERYRQRQLITIAMGNMGFLSRISGWLFGSIMTYGNIGKATAPGQATVKEMKELIGQLRKNILS